MNIFKRLFGKKQKPSPIPPPHTQLRFPTPRGISGNSLKDRSSKSEDDYYERQRRQNQDALDSAITFYPPIYDFDRMPTIDEPKFGGYGGGDSGGGGASGSWDNGSSDSGSYDSGSSDSGGCDSGGSSD